MNSGLTLVRDENQEPVQSSPVPWSVCLLSLRSAGSEEENSGAVYSVDVDIPFILLHKDWEHDGYCSRTKQLHHTVNAT